MEPFLSMMTVSVPADSAGGEAVANLKFATKVDFNKIHKINDFRKNFF